MAARKSKPEPATLAAPTREDLRVVYRNPVSLIPYARNARTHTPEQVEEIKRSIVKFGFTNPVLLKDDDKTIGAGHARTMEAIALKLDRVPTITLHGLTDAEWRAYVIADNKLALNSGWDVGLLKLELSELQGAGFDLSLTGFAPADLKGIFFPEPESSAGLYTGKVKTPAYIPRGDAPAVSTLLDEAKTKALKAEIVDAPNLPRDVADFLLKAADRHTVFDFHRIADFYAHADAPTQRLMEKSALVIIDFDSAIENGFVRLNEKLEAMAPGPEDEE
jgi:hypothetical protein